MSREIGRITNWLLTFGLIVLLVGCNKSDTPSLKAFSSPEDAGNALLQR